VCADHKKQKNNKNKKRSVMLGFAFAAITTAAIILASRTPPWPSAQIRADRDGSGRPNGTDARAATDDARFWDAGGSKREAGPDAS